MRRPLLALIAAAALAGCGDEEAPDPRTPPPYIGAVPVAPPGQRLVEREIDARDARRLRPVIADWADAVRAGDVGRAAGHFSLPAIVARPGGGPLQLNSPAVVAAFNAALPCASRLRDTEPDGRLVVATFVLEDAGDVSCPDAGETSRVGFAFGDAARPRAFTEWWEPPDAAPAARPARAETATVSDFG